MPEGRGESEIWKESWEAEMELGVISLQTLKPLLLKGM